MQTVRRDAHNKQSVSKIKTKAMLQIRRIAFVFISVFSRVKSITSTLLHKVGTALAISTLFVPGSVLVLGLNNKAIAAESTYINFQARILQSSGALVPDGYYNVQFKLYDAPSTGNLLWTETWYDENGSTAGSDYRVNVKNGYVSVRLGERYEAQNAVAFPSTINWDQKLYLTMNIGGTTQTANPSWDGEMSPRFLMTSVPYAKEAKTAAGVTSNNTNATSTNSDSVSVSTGNASGATSNSGGITIDTGTATGTTGTISIAGTNASGLTLARSGLQTTIAGNALVQGGTLTVGTTSQAGSLVISDGSNNTVTLTASGVGTSYSLVLPTAAGTTSQCLMTSASDASQLVFGSCGASGAVTTIGTIDTQTKSANGAVIASGTLYMQTADATNVGLVSIGTQTFAGNKTFTGTTTFSSAANVTSGTLTVGADSTTNGTITLYSSGAVADPTISANSTGDLTVQAPAGSTIVGDGTGGIQLQLTNAADGLTGTKTFTASGAYSSDDFSFTRTVTGGANALSGSVFYLNDASTTSSTNTANILNINAPSSSTGNLIIATTGGSTERFKVTAAGNTSVGGTLAVSGNVTANANLTVGSGAGVGLFTNNGATLNATLAVSNLATGGAIGTAAATVDIYTSATLNQTTTGQSVSVPNPTTTTAGRLFYLSNIGTASFTLLGTTINAGTTASLMWSGSAWQFTGADGSGILNQNSAIQTANFQISGTGQAGTLNATSAIQLNGTSINTSGTLSNVAYLPQANTFTANNIFQGTVTIQTSTSTQDQIVIQAAATGSNRFAGTITNADLTAARTYTLPDASGTLAVSASGNIALSAAGNITFTGTLGVTNGGTGTATQFTQGSVVFAGASGVYSQSNANFFWDNTNSRLGIGDATPAAALTVGSGDLFQVNTSGAIAAVTGITTTGGYTQSGTTANTFTGASTFSATGTALSVTNNATIGGTLGVTGNVTASANLTVGSGAGVGLFTNNGATLNSTLAISDLATGGAIGTAAATVDIYTSATLNQTTASQSITIPSPTSTTAGRIFYLSNIGTASVTFTNTYLTSTLSPNTTASLIWSGSAWLFAGADGNGILNQNSTAQTANFQISGTGRANTSFLTPTLDVATAGTLSVGTSTATAITLGKAGITTTNAGALTVSQLLTGSLGATISGAAISLNDSSNFAVNIGTGTNNSLVTIGGGSGTFSLQTTNIDISNTGAISGVTTLGLSGAITGATATNTINGLIISSGALSGITGYSQTSGNFLMSGTGTFGTGTGAISLNGDVTVAAGKSLTMSSGAGAFSQTSTATTGDILSVTASSLAPAAAATGNGSKVTVSQAAANTSGNSIVNAYNAVTTLNTSGATGTKDLTAYNASATTLTACTGGSCTVNGFKVTTSANTLATVSQNGLNIVSSGISAGALNGVNIAGITASTGTETAINIGSGWDNVLSVGGSAIINGTGVIQSAGLSGSYTGITGVGTITAGTWNGTTIAVANGGTGATTLTQNGVLYGNGTSAVGITAAGTTGQCLVATTSAAPSWGTCGASGTFLNKNATDTSSAAVGAASYLYTFTNSGSAATGGVLSLSNGTNTGNILNVLGTGNGTYIFANNTNASPSGNLIDLQSSSTSKFSVTAAGAVTTSGQINSQTISSSANFTGTLAVNGSSLTLGAASTTTGTVVLRNSGGAGGVTLTTASPGASSYTITLPAQTGTVCTTGSVCTGYQAAGTYVSTVGTFSASSQTNGATISGSTITFGPADATNPGMVSTGAQTIAGAKTFTGATTVKLTSATAFTVQNASAVTVLAVDTASTNGSLRVYDLAGGSNYASISYVNSSSTAIFAASSGTTQVGTGSGAGGDINLLLTTATDNLNASKTFSAAAAYSDNDFNFTRTVTGTTYAVTGSVVRISDQSSFTSGSSAPNVLLVNQNNTSATGNLLLLQTGGATTRFSVNTSGDTTVSGGLTVAGNTNITGSLYVSGDISYTNLTVGASAGIGLFTNNGATYNATLALGDFASGGSIGSAASTVDIYTSISIAQTTSGRTLTLPNPTSSTSYGRTIYISNVGTNSFLLNTVTINAGASAVMVWSNTNGAASWQYAGAGDTFADGGNSFGHDAYLGTDDGYALYLTANNVALAQFTSAGAINLNATAASSFTTSSGDLSLSVASTGTGSVQIGTGAGTSTPDILELDNKNSSGDPATSYVGGMYYNSTTGKFRCNQVSVWYDCLSPWITIKKTADQDVTNSVNLVDDTALQFTVTSGTTYAVRFNICYAGNNAANDYKGTFTFPTAINLKNVSGRYVGTTTTDTIQTSGGVLGIATNFPTAAGLSMGTASAFTDKRILEGFFSYQANAAGTLRWQFAQVAAAASTTARTCANSFIEYQAL